MTAVAKKRLTAEEYLAIERQAEFRSEYVLVDQAAAQIEHFVLETDGKWSLTELSGLDKTLILDSIGCQIPFAEVYRKVTFAEATQGIAPEAKK
jgi:hypothetical protein